MDKFPLSMVLLLENKPKAKATCISEESCGLSDIIKCQNRSSGQYLIVEGMSVIRDLTKGSCFCY